VGDRRGVERPDLVGQAVPQHSELPNEGRRVQAVGCEHVTFAVRDRAPGAPTFRAFAAAVAG